MSKRRVQGLKSETMRGRVVHKLLSVRGASLSMALLLMLVCVAVSAVVLVSGTAASGRLYNLVRMDRHYYNVTSALEFMNDELAEQTATVTETMTYTKTEDSSTDTASYQITSRNIDTTTNADVLAGGDFAKSFARYLVAGTNSSFTGEIQVSGNTLDEDVWEDFFYDWEDSVYVCDSALNDELAFEMDVGWDDTPKVSGEVAFSGIEDESGAGEASFIKGGSGAGAVTFTSTSGKISYSMCTTLVPSLTHQAPSSSESVEGNVKTCTVTKSTTISWTLADVAVGEAHS